MVLFHLRVIWPLSGTWTGGWEDGGPMWLMMTRRGLAVAVGLEEESGPCKRWRPAHPVRGFPESVPVSPPRLQSVGDQPVSELPRVTAS